MLQPPCSCLKEPMESSRYSLFLQPKKISSISWFILGSIVNNYNPFKPPPPLDTWATVRTSTCAISAEPWRTAHDKGVQPAASWPTTMEQRSLEITENHPCLIAWNRWVQEKVLNHLAHGHGRLFVLQPKINSTVNKIKSFLESYGIFRLYFTNIFFKHLYPKNYSATWISSTKTELCHNIIKNHQNMFHHNLQNSPWILFRSNSLRSLPKWKKLHGRRITTVHGKNPANQLIGSVSHLYMGLYTLWTIIISNYIQLFITGLYTL